MPSDKAPLACPESEKMFVADMAVHLYEVPLATISLFIFHKFSESGLKSNISEKRLNFSGQFTGIQRLGYIVITTCGQGLFAVTGHSFGS